MNTHTFRFAEQHFANIDARPAPMEPFALIGQGVTACASATGWRSRVDGASGLGPACGVSRDRILLGGREAGNTAGSAGVKRDLRGEMSRKRKQVSVTQSKNEQNENFK